MRLIISLLFLCLAIAVLVLTVTVLTDPSKTYDLFARLQGSESIEKHAMEPFVPPKSSYRVYFPATKPRELPETLAFTRQSPLPSPQYYVADQDLALYATTYVTDIVGVDKTRVGAPQQSPSLMYAAAQTSVVMPATVDESKQSFYYDPMALQNFLDTKCEGIASKNNATITNKYPISLKGGVYPGRYMEGAFKNTKNAYRMKFFLDPRSRQVVAIAAVGKPKRVYSPQVNKFLSSVDMWY